MTDHPLRIFSGSAHPALAQEIADLLGTSLGKSTTLRMPDSEIYITIDEVVRDQDIFFVQPCSTPVNDNLIELLLYLDAFRRASVHRISAVIPYFPYARQDRMAHGREAISARVVANLLETMGVSRVIYVDIHNRAIQGFFNIPVDPLSALPILSDYFVKVEVSRNTHLWIDKAGGVGAQQADVVSVRDVHAFLFERGTLFAGFTESTSDNDRSLDAPLTAVFDGFGCSVWRDDKNRKVNGIRNIVEICVNRAFKQRTLFLADEMDRALISALDQVACHTVAKFFW